jgi:hypothetical protein
VDVVNGIAKAFDEFNKFDRKATNEGNGDQVKNTFAAFQSAVQGVDKISKAINVPIQTVFDSVKAGKVPRLFRGLGA